MSQDTPTKKIRVQVDLTPAEYELFIRIRRHYKKPGAKILRRLILAEGVRVAQSA